MPDSLVTTTIDTVAQQPVRPRSPYQALRKLPRDATPAQQDSVIQAWFQPGEIHYSDRPDTLHLPGHDVGTSVREVNLPQYYRETFFARDTLLHPEVGGGRMGVAGDPMPYTIKGDSAFTLLLLLCFAIFIVAVGRSRQFITRQLKDLLFLPRTDADSSETSDEIRTQLFLVLLTCMLLGITTFMYVSATVTDTFVIDDNLQVVALFTGAYAAWFVAKWFLGMVVNLSLFDWRRHVEWMHTNLFLTTSAGMLFFPAVLWQVYFDLSLHQVQVYFIFILFLLELATFYKCWTIFFRSAKSLFNNFLYFCALEMIPLLALVGVMRMIVAQLQVNY